jgi:hypothetical protein
VCASAVLPQDRQATQSQSSVAMTLVSFSTANSAARRTRVAIPSRYGDAFIDSAAAQGEIRTEAGKTPAIVSKPSHIVSRVYREGDFDLLYVASR